MASRWSAMEHSSVTWRPPAIVRSKVARLPRPLTDPLASMVDRESRREPALTLSTANLTDELPVFRTSTFMRSYLILHWGTAFSNPALTKRDAGSRSLHVMPFPVANLRQVLPIFSDVFLVFDALVADRLLGVGGNRAQAQSVDHVRDKMKAIHIIEKDHIERRRRGPFLLVAAHVEIVVIGPSIR